MVDTSTLCVGDKVRIVSEWNSDCNENSEGLMDKYLGKVMTVQRSNEWQARMLEDGGRWAWNEFTIAEVIDDDIELATQEELLVLLMR